MIQMTIKFLYILTDKKLEQFDIILGLTTRKIIFNGGYI